MIDKLNEVLKEVGISKVRLAKFLGVSRQMIYNYLELESINKWPKDKKLLLLNLLGVKTPEEIATIKVDTDYIYTIDEKLNDTVIEECNDFSNLNKKEKALVQDMSELLKEKVTTTKGYNTVLYLYHLLQSVDSSPELNYMLGYISKATGFAEPEEFAFDEKQQFRFEGIMFSAFNLYNSEIPSINKIAASREKFVAGIEQKKEEKLSRTVELKTLKAQALRELGYTSMTEENNSEILIKMAEIESRKVVS